MVSIVLEKLVNNRIVDHLEKCGLFSDFQYGHSVHPPFLQEGEGGVEPPTKFSKSVGGRGGGLTGPQLL